jgi:hypothetical protein
VVVRVEPLRHLERLVVLVATRQCEVDGQVARAVGHHVGESVRDRAQGERGVEHLVVEAEALGHSGTGRRQTEFDQAGAGRRPQLASGLDQFGLARAALPEGLDGALELTAAAETRVTEDRCVGQGRRCGHAGPSTRERVAASEEPRANLKVSRAPDIRPACCAV